MIIARPEGGITTAFSIGDHSHWKDLLAKNG
jgi:hypothetical protein